MFVIDAFIGNRDRHNGNWRFLYNLETDEMRIALIFDCGSSLYPQIDDELIKEVLNSESEMDFRVFGIPTSAIFVDGKRGNYFKIISSLEYQGCNEALKRIVPRINLEEINFLIDVVEALSDLKKEFLEKILKLRKEIILDFASQKLKK